MALNAADVKKLFQDPDLGNLIFRITFGIMIIALGVPKFMSGGENLADVGKVVSVLGLNFAPIFWGFLIALVEVMGGIMILFGFLFRPASFLLMVAMVVGSVYVARHGATFENALDWPTYAVYAGAFLGLLFEGPGRFSIQKD